MDSLFLLSMNSLFNSMLILNQHNIDAIASMFYQPVSTLAVIPIQQGYTPLTILLSLISGAIVGFSLGLIGGGGFYSCCSSPALCSRDY